jgi:hypothetical protein
MDFRPFPIGAISLIRVILAGNCYTFPELLSSPITCPESAVGKIPCGEQIIRLQIMHFHKVITYSVTAHP